MRLLTYLLGQMVILLGLEISRASAPGWVWVWWVCGFFWFAVGLAVAIVGLVGSILKRNPTRTGITPAPRPAPVPAPQPGE